MVELLKKYRKLILILLLLTFCFAGYKLYVGVKNNFDHILKTALAKYVGIEVEYSDIRFKENRTIEVLDFTMNGEINPNQEKLEPIVKADKVVIEYRLIGFITGKIIEDIRAENPLIYVTLDKDWNVNFAKLFSNGKKQEKSEPAGSKVPIKTITVKNASLVYQDFHFDRPIKKNLDAVNGYVRFDRSGISLEFSGNEGTGWYNYSFSNKNRYSMNIKVKDAQIDDTMMQYAFTEKYVEYESGVADVDITIKPGNYTGYANLSNGTLRYKDLEDSFYSVNAKVLLDGKNIKISSSMFLDENSVKFSLDKYGEKYILGLKSGDLNYKDLLKYKLIRDLNLNYKEDVYIEDVDAKFYIEKGKFSVDTYFSLGELKLNGFQLSGISGNLTYKDKKIGLEDLSTNFIYDRLDTAVEGELNLDAKIEDKKWNIEYKVENLISDSNLGSLNGNVAYNVETKKGDFTVNSAIIDLVGKIDSAQKEFELSSNKIEDFNIFYRGEYRVDGYLDVVYNYGTKKLKKGTGDIVIKDKYFEELALKFSAEDNVVTLEHASAKKAGYDVEAIGIANLDDLTYRVNFQKLNLDVGQLLKKDIEAEFTGKALLKGKGKKFEAYVDAESKIGKYYLKYEGLKTKIFINYDEELKAYGDTKFGTIGYNGEKLYDILVKSSFENNELHFQEISNNLLTISGYYNIIESNIDLKYELKDFYLEKVHFLKEKGFGGTASEISGKVEGRISDPLVTVDLKNLKLNYKNFENIATKGKVMYKAGQLKFENLYIDKNLVNGQVDIKNSNFDLKFNIFENSLFSYYNDKNFRYRVIGELNAWGNFDDVKAASDVVLDNVYYRGRQVPDAKLRMTYRGGDIKKILSSGVLNFQEFSLLDNNDEKLLGAKGYIDFENENLKISMPNESLDFEKLSYLFNKKVAQGKLFIDMDLEGKFKELKYSAALRSRNIKVSEFDIENIDAYVVGDSNRFEINKMNLDYEGNNLNLTGEMAYQPFDYKFRLKSEDIDLKFLNIFLYKKNVSNLVGAATMDLYISDEGNQGKLSIGDLGFSIEDKKLDFSGISTDINLDKKEVKIAKFDGKVNNGDIDMEGYLRLPELSLKNLEEKKIDLNDYYLNLKLDSISYNYLKVIDLILSSDLKLQKNAVTGDIVVEKGEILGIPVFEKTAKKDTEVKPKLGFLKEFFKKDVFNFRRDIDTNLLTIEPEKQAQNGFKMDIDLMIAEPIKFRIEKMPLVEDFEANIEGAGKLRYRNSKFNFLGRIFTEDGVITFNNNLFEIQNGVLIFSDENDYFPDINPSISITARSEIANEEVYVNINGEYDNLELQLTSSSGLSQEDIGSLLIFHNTLDESSANAVVKDILDKQISEQLFRPISSELERIFGIESIKISSDIVAYQYQEGQYVDSETLRLGAAIELQNPLYKDVINWNAKASLSDTQNTDTIDTYDLWLDYKIKENISWGIGAQKLSSDLSGDRENQLNYHINLNFKKRLDSIFDIFKFK
jgi:hypothetical protein